MNENPYASGNASESDPRILQPGMVFPYLMLGVGLLVLTVLFSLPSFDLVTSGGTMPRRYAVYEAEFSIWHLWQPIVQISLAGLSATSLVVGFRNAYLRRKLTR